MTPINFIVMSVWKSSKIKLIVALALFHRVQRLCFHPLQVGTKRFDSLLLLICVFCFFCFQWPVYDYWLHSKIIMTTKEHHIWKQTYVKHSVNQSSLFWIAVHRSMALISKSLHSSKQASEYILHDSFVRFSSPNLSLVSIKICTIRTE